MCHHGDHAALESWREELDKAEEPERREEEAPSFANEDSDVEVDLLEADDD